VTPGVVRPVAGVRVFKNVLVPMADGVCLAADVYLPDDGTDDLAAMSPTAAVMDYIPYRKDEAHPAAMRWYLRLVAAGYAVVRVDIRGTGASEGSNTDEYTPQEQADGAACVEWIAAQPWCDGHVNIMGISYGGFTALQIAALAPPHLTSIIPVDFTDDRYTDDCHYRGGLLRMYYDIGWYGTRMAAWGAMPPDPDSSTGDWAAVWEQHLAENTPYQLEWLRHQVDGPYWRNGSVGAGGTIACPAFLIGGWRDGYPNPPLRLFAALRGPRKLLIGPWNHAMPDGAIPGPRIDYLREVVRWLDHWCRGADTGIMAEPPVQLYVQHWQPPEVDRLDSAGEWRAEVRWPAPGARDETRWLAADGALTDEGPPAPGEDRFAADPLVGLAGGLWSGGVPYGLPGDQRPDEARSRVYTSAPLAEPITIIGQPRAVLHLASTATVIGFAVALSDVAPDGSSHLVTKGMLNATRRRSLAEPEPVVPGEPFELTVDLDATAWRFEPGHRLRVAVSSADFPNVWPTPEAAWNTVFRGPDRPSRLVLPGVPEQASAPPPSFAPSTMAVARHSAAIRPPTWQVSTDVLTGRVAVTVTVDVSFRVDERTVIERSWGSVSELTPSDPAHASARGWHVCRSIRPNQVVESRADTVIQSTATDLHITIDLVVRVNEAVHATRRWTETLRRALL